MEWALAELKEREASSAGEGVWDNSDGERNGARGSLAARRP